MSLKIGIVGATGAVGQECIELLHSRKFPFTQLSLLASARSAGKTMSYAGNSWTVAETTADSFNDLDIAIFSAGADISKLMAPEAAKRGCVVIDNSSAFRMDHDVPLVVPEINADACFRHKGIIANPNCSTAVTLMALYPLHLAFGLKRFFASTYQAVSGIGDAGIPELQAQMKALCQNQEPPRPETFQHPIAYNLIPQVDVFLEDGYTKEEYKMRNESRKIMSLPDLRVSTTCVRVPVLRAHSISVKAEFERPVDLEVARRAISQFSGAELCDNPSEKVYPMPLNYSRKEACGVGRIRRDTAFDNGIALWVVGDQLWKGAALNAVQIAELLIR